MSETDRPMVDSASDQRVVNNTARHQYRVLSEVEKQQVTQVKDAGLAFIELLHAIGGTPPNCGAHLKSRELSIAQTKIEEGVMWAVKHVTR
jgi:hypothetical protein